MLDIDIDIDIDIDVDIDRLLYLDVFVALMCAMNNIDNHVQSLCCEDWLQILIFSLNIDFKNHDQYQHRNIDANQSPMLRVPPLRLR